MMTIRFPSDWIARSREALARLADRPWLLFVVLFAVHTIGRPYAGITHDARLYAGQVLNRVENGIYGDDLFFRYGSQDQYSLFSMLAAPLIRAVGLQAGFFLIYLLSKALLILGVMRILTTLVPNRVASTLALLYVMTVPLHYGGLNLLSVQETFVTPRMLACGLTLLGLDMTLRGRPVLSGSMLLLAMAVHPLMAFGGLLIWSGFHCWKLLGGRVFFVLTIGLIAGAGFLLAYEPLGLRLFGTMDEEWRESILASSSFNFPSEWARRDWFFVAFQLALTFVALGRYRALDADKARFALLLALVSLSGIALAVIAEQTPYALLLQGQAYRALWILAVLQLGFVCWLLVDLASCDSRLGNLAACGLLAYLTCHDHLGDECLVPLLIMPLVVVALRGLEWTPRDVNWLPHSLQLSLILGALGWTVYKLCLLVSGFGLLLQKHPELRDIINVLLANLGPVALVLPMVWILTRCRDAWWEHRRAWALAGAGCVGVQTCFFALPQTSFYVEHCTSYRADLRRVREVLDTRHSMQRLPTVYSNLGCLEYTWVDLRAKSYFDWWQAGGFMFHRETACEGQRRARLVAPFEVERYRKQGFTLTGGDKQVINRLFKVDFDQVQLTLADLARLVQEPDLDYIVLDQRFEGLYSSQFGSLYLYDCKQTRTLMYHHVNKDVASNARRVSDAAIRATRAAAE